MFRSNRRRPRAYKYWGDASEASIVEEHSMYLLSSGTFRGDGLTCHSDQRKSLKSIRDEVV